MSDITLPRATVEQLLDHAVCINSEQWVIRKIDRTALRAALDAAQPEPVADAMTYGIGATLGGKRIDPRDLYLEPQPEPVARFDERTGHPVLLDNAPMLQDGQPLYTAPPSKPLHDAAPDLLEALYRLISTGLDARTHHEFMSDPAHYARAAIAKAEGK